MKGRSGLISRQTAPATPPGWSPTAASTPSTRVPLGFFIPSVALPAWVMLIYWAVLQRVGGFSRVGAEGVGPSGPILAAYLPAWCW